MSDFATLEVPSNLYDEALAFVNARRAEKSLAPIDTLPAGYAGDASSCPCAAQCGAPITVGDMDWYWDDGDAIKYENAPSGFVCYFDEKVAEGLLTLPIRSVSK